MIDGPPRRWIAPSTPPPPTSAEFAALTIASARNALMSPVVSARTRSPTRSSSIERGATAGRYGPATMTSCGGLVRVVVSLLLK